MANLCSDIMQASYEEVLAHDEKSLLVSKDAINDDVLTLDKEAQNQHDIKMANILKVPSVNHITCLVTQKTTLNDVIRDDT